MFSDRTDSTSELASVLKILCILRQNKCGLDMTGDLERRMEGRKKQLITWLGYDQDWPAWKQE